MAVPPTNEAFLREVDDELRRDQAMGLARRYGLIAIGAIVLALVALAAFFFWRHMRNEAAVADGVKLQAAYDQLGAEKFAEAGKPLAELAGSDASGYRVLAKFTQADILLKDQKLAAAAAKFAEVANDTSAAEPFRNLALIRQTSAEFDTLKPDVVVSRLRALAQPGNPWLGSAGELVAAAYLKQGRRDLAGKLFSQIAKDEDVPPTLRQRAVQMAGVMGVDAVDGSGDDREGTTKR